MILSNGYYEGDVFAKLGKPALHGPFSILQKAITIYEGYDDLGDGPGFLSSTTGNTGMPLACCNIKPLNSLLDRTYVASNLMDDRRLNAT